MTTIGQRLKEAREDQRLTLDKVFEDTRIRVQYLQALEADDLSVMPSPVQARGYLRNYVEYLGLNIEEALDQLREANAQKPSDEVIGPADVPDSPATSEPQAPMDEPPIQALPPLTKPKPVRRKKVPSETGDASTPTLTKRRGRKKAEPEADANAAVSAGAESQVREDPTPQPQTILPPDVTPLPTSGTDIPSVETRSEILEEPIAESDVPVIEPLAPAEPDVNDSLWQSWLNRLSSVLAARNKRSTLVQNQELISEIQAEPSVVTETVIEQPLEENSFQEGSTLIFREIGMELRDRRELLSLHLEEVERNTHVKAHYLDALERGAMDDLPSTVQTRGMLSNYATFLDLDVDALLLRYADALQASHRERNPQKTLRKPGQPILANVPPMRTFIAGDLIFGVGIVVLLVGFAIWGVSRIMMIQSQREVQPTAPSISDILLASPEVASNTATPTLLPVESFPGEATVTVVIPTLNADVSVQVNLIAVERTYMKVVADGETKFEGRVVPGTAYPFEAVEQVEVLVGSGAAIRIVYNGRDLGLLGSFGQVVSNIYLPDDIITPTGMPTSTPTITPTSTKTPVPTSTSRFTATPVPSSTAIP